MTCCIIPKLMTFKEFILQLEIYGTNVALSQIDDEGDGGDRRIRDMIKPGAFPTHQLPVKAKKTKKDKIYHKFN